MKINCGGTIRVQSEQTIDSVVFKPDGAELTLFKEEASLAFNKLINESEVKFDPTTRQFKLEMGLTVQSERPGALSTTLSVVSPSIPGTLEFKGTIKSDQIKGKVDSFAYVASDLKFEINVILKADDRKSVREPAVLSASAMPAVPVEENDWGKVLFIAAIGTAVTIVVATVAEDIVTAGAGVWNDAASFSAAAAMFRYGVQGLSGVAPVAGRMVVP